MCTLCKMVVVCRGRMRGKGGWAGSGWLTNSGMRVRGFFSSPGKGADRSGCGEMKQSPQDFRTEREKGSIRGNVAVERKDTSKKKWTARERINVYLFIKSVKQNRAHLHSSGSDSGRAVLGMRGYSSFDTPISLMTTPHDDYHNVLT